MTDLEKLVELRMAINAAREIAHTYSWANTPEDVTERAKRDVAVSLAWRKYEKLEKEYSLLERVLAPTVGG